MVERFSVLNTVMGETLAVVEMDESLLRPEAGIIDSESLTMRPIKGGGIYTLLPAQDHTVSALRMLYNSFKNIKDKPCPSFSAMMGRTDNLIEAVGVVFGEVEYVVIESIEDMTLLLNPQNGRKPKTIKRSILGDLLDKVLSEDSAQTTNDK